MYIIIIRLVNATREGVSTEGPTAGEAAGDQFTKVSITFWILKGLHMYH